GYFTPKRHSQKRYNRDGWELGSSKRYQSATELSLQDRNSLFCQARPFIRVVCPLLRMGMLEKSQENANQPNGPPIQTSYIWRLVDSLMCLKSLPLLAKLQYVTLISGVDNGLKSFHPRHYLLDIHE
ncbi:6581_t:CDS:2, partial [Acaulospora colombiana]